MTPQIFAGLFPATKTLFLRSVKQNDIEKANWIITVVAYHYGIDRDSILGQSRKEEIVLARQVSMHLIRNRTTLSLKNTGSFFQGRGHDTVIHSINIIENLLDEKKSFRLEMLKIIEKINYHRFN